MFKNIIGTHKPDILDCISNLSSDEVFTPPSVVNQVLDLLPQDVWANPKLKFLDPACKSGVFLREAAKRLMIGLEPVIEDEDVRRKHIFQNMLYGIPITELTGYIARRSVYYSKVANSKHSVVEFENEQGNIVYKRGSHNYVRGKCTECGAPEGVLDRGEQLENYAYQFIHKNEVTKMKFDVIIGNPPYQLQDAGDSTGASPIYHLFVNQAKKLDPRYISMIIPSRWFAGGKGLDTFRSEMLKDKRISHLVDFHDAADCFPGVEIKGGVCYFLWDSKHNGPCEVTPVVGGERLIAAKRHIDTYDVFVRFNQSITILEKVRKKGERAFSERMSSQKPFGFRTNFTDFKDKAFKGAVQIYAFKAIGWVDRNLIAQNDNWVDKYKVIISRSYNGGYTYPHQITNKPIVCEKGSCCTETYIVCDVLETLEEANNLASYMKSKFFRFLVSIRKISQDNPKDRFDFVPLLDLKKSWTDKDLYARYDLTVDEIDFIEKMIREMV
jgi:site-specific DNA-methyltransferase (adenine-specific)